MESERILEVGDVTAMLRRRWRMIASVTFLGVLGVLLFLALVTPYYTAEATLKFDPEKLRIGGERNTQDETIAPVPFLDVIQGEMAAIRSPEVLRAVVTSERLHEDPELVETPAWGRFFRDILPEPAPTPDGVHKTLLDRSLSNIRRLLVGVETNDPDRFKDVVASELNERLSVKQPMRTTLLTVGFTSRSPEKAAKIANKVASAYLTQHRRSRSEVTEQTSDWLKSRIDDLRARWQASERKLEEFKADNKLSFVVGESLAERDVAELNEQVVLASAKAKEAQARYQRVRRLLKSSDYDQLSSSDQTPVMTRLRQDLTRASLMVAQLSMTLMPAHPTLKQAHAARQVVVKQIDAEARLMLQDLRIKAEVARDSEAKIRTSMDEAIKRMRGARGSLVKLRELERDAASNKSVYETFLKKAKQSSEKVSGPFVDFRLARAASVPTIPSYPSATKFILFAAIGSLGAGIGLALLLELLYDRFKYRRHVLDVLDMPHLGTLPRLFGHDLKPRAGCFQPERAVAFVRDPEFSRHIAGLRAGLRLIAPESGPKVVAVTSALAGEGKTLAATSLAQHAAINGARALLIDCDFQGRHRTQSLQDRPRSEPAEPMSRGSLGDSPVVRDYRTGLDVLSFAAAKTNTTDFLSSEAFADLLTSSRASYDFVVIDTEAVHANPEPWVIASAVDAVLFVVLWDKTRRTPVRLALEQLTMSSFKPVGVVLNGANMRLIGRDYQREDFESRATLPARQLARAEAQVRARANRVRPSAPLSQAR